MLLHIYQNPGFQSVAASHPRGSSTLHLIPPYLITYPFAPLAYRKFSLCTLFFPFHVDAGEQLPKEDSWMQDRLVTFTMNPGTFKALEAQTHRIL